MSCCIYYSLLAHESAVTSWNHEEQTCHTTTATAMACPFERASANCGLWTPKDLHFPTLLRHQ